MCNSTDFFRILETRTESDSTSYTKKEACRNTCEKYFLHIFLVDKCCNEGTPEKYCKIGFCNRYTEFDIGLS